MALERVRSPPRPLLLPYYGGPLQANLSLAGRHFPGLRLSTAISGWNCVSVAVALALQARPDLVLNPENPKVALQEHGRCLPVSGSNFWPLVLLLVLVLEGGHSLIPSSRTRNSSGSKRSTKRVNIATSRASSSLPGQTRSVFVIRLAAVQVRKHQLFLDQRLAPFN